MCFIIRNTDSGVPEEITITDGKRESHSTTYFLKIAKIMKFIDFDIRCRDLATLVIFEFTSAFDHFIYILPEVLRSWKFVFIIRNIDSGVLQEEITITDRHTF